MKTDNSGCKKVCLYALAFIMWTLVFSFVITGFAVNIWVGVAFCSVVILTHLIVDIVAAYRREQVPDNTPTDESAEENEEEPDDENEEEDEDTEQEDEEIEETVRKVMERFGRVDILVNNAGTGAVAYLKSG